MKKLKTNHASFDEHVKEWACGCQIAIGNDLPIWLPLWAGYYIWRNSIIKSINNRGKR